MHPRQSFVRKANALGESLLAQRNEREVPPRTGRLGHELSRDLKVSAALVELVAPVGILARLPLLDRGRIYGIGHPRVAGIAGILSLGIGRPGGCCVA